MTIELRTLLSKSEDRMGEGMHPVVKEAALEVIKRAYAEGIYVQLSAGFRSIAEQNALYVQGRRGIKGEKIVTNAKGGQSVHNYGLAVDYFLVTPDGKTALWTVDDKWRRVAAIAKELGFEWGGDWNSFPDPPHLQMTGGLTISQLQKGMKPNLTSVVKSASISKPNASSNESIVDYLNSNGIDSSFSNRTKLASQYGIADYKGTATQNIELLEKIKQDSRANTKEEDIMSQKFIPSNQAIKDAVSTVLSRFEQKDPALSPNWREKANAGKLTINDAVGLLYVAVERGYITGKCGCNQEKQAPLESIE